MSAAWSLPGRFGTETWMRGDRGFERVRAGTDLLELPVDPLTAERLALRQPGCLHAGPMPAAFRFCPACGAPTHPAGPASTSDPWSPPFGGTDGLPHVPEARLPVEDGPEEVPCPDGACLGFAVAGTPSMLLCCDRSDGRVHGWSESGRRWIERVQVPACAGLPSWSWSAAASERGMAMPTDAGPVFLPLQAPRGVAPLQAPGRAVCLGGAILLRGFHLVPVWSDNRLAVAVLDAAAENWRLVSVSDASAETPEDGFGPLAAPVLAVNNAIWCGAAGRLSVQLGPEGPVAGWRSWADGVRPLLRIRPVIERNGMPHQLARLDAATLVHEALAVPGQAAERRLARGYAIGTGRAVFRENQLLRLPWDERELADYVLPDQSFILPLLQLDEQRFVLAVCSRRDRLGAFLGDPLFEQDGGDGLGTTVTAHSCALVFSRGPRMLQSLDCTLRARSASDLSVFVFADRLWAHGVLDNRLHRWPLVDAR